MKNHRLLGFLSAFLVVMASLIGCSNDVNPREGAVQGKVVNLAGKAVADALIEWQYDNTRWSITNKEGNYYIDGVGFGDQLFNVTANGYRSLTFTAPVYSGQTTSVKDLSLQKMSFTYSNIKVEKTTATNVVISWNTSDYTNSIIEYGLSESLGKYARETEGLYTTNHRVEVTGLEPEKTYYFKISANRQGQSIESSAISTFTTLSSLEDGTAPYPPTGVETALNGIPNQVVVFWTPNSETDLKGYKVYRSEVANGKFTEISNGFIARNQERFTDTSVITGKKYFYHVTAIDKANNESGYNNVSEILVPGDITSSVTWTVANSPYIVKGDINVTEFGALNIDGGVKILVSDTDELRSGNDTQLIEFNISGALIASAGNTLPITVTSSKTTSGKGAWKGFVFNNVTNVSNTMVNFDIRHAETAIALNNTKGVFSNINISNVYTGINIRDCKDVTLNEITTKNSVTGIIANNNVNLCVKDCTFLHPANAILSDDNNGMVVKGCNILENTGAGIISNEKSGVVEFTNNLFVSPIALGLQINGKCQRVEYSVFDTPYAIQIKSEVPVIQKNLFMAERAVSDGIYSEGQKCIEYLGLVSNHKFGPNNTENFPDDKICIGCLTTDDSTKYKDLMLMKDLYETKYDYRLKQPYPSNADSWGIKRDTIPYSE